MTSLRWIADGAFDGPTNMARDEALLQRVGSGDSPPTLRFYRWDPPTISLGYFQDFAEYQALPPPAGQLAVVRRQTGGGAILHDQELTYALVLPIEHPLVAGGRCNALYDHVHSAFTAVLARHKVPITRPAATAGGCAQRGPFFCFERHSCFDLLAQGRKLMGSAQRRTAGAVLQHGSLVLDSRFGQQACSTVHQFAPSLDVDTLLEQIARAISGDAMERAEHLDPAELALAAELRGKYAGAEWNRRR